MVNEERLSDIEAWKNRYEHLEREVVVESENLRHEYSEKLKEEIVRYPGSLA